MHGAGRVKVKCEQGSTFLKLEQIVNSGHWLWKYWWKNDQKILKDLWVVPLSTSPINLDEVSEDSELPVSLKQNW